MKGGSEILDTAWKAKERLWGGKKWGRLRGGGGEKPEAGSLLSISCLSAVRDKVFVFAFGWESEGGSTSVANDPNRRS